MNMAVAVRPETVLKTGALRLLIDIQTYYYGEPFSLGGLRKRFGSTHGNAEALQEKLAWLMTHGYAERGLSTIYSLTKEGRSFSDSKLERSGGFHIEFHAREPDPPPEERRDKRDRRR